MPRKAPSVPVVPVQQAPIIPPKMELRAHVDVRAMPLAARAKHADGIFIVSPRIQRRLDRMTEAASSFGLFNIKCGMFTGDTGAGKTTIVQHFLTEIFPRIAEWTPTDPDEQPPYLMISVTGNATPRSLACDLLKATGDPMWDRGSSANILQRVVALLRDSGVRLIVMDEFQHLVVIGSHHLTHQVADFVKSLVIQSGIPVLAFGQSRATATLQSSGEFARRFCVRESFDPFAYATAADCLEFQGFLHAMDLMLPLAERSRLALPATAEKIHRATSGIPGYIRALVTEAAWHAVQSGRERITTDDLAWSFQNYVVIDLPNIDNPFV